MSTKLFLKLMIFLQVLICLAAFVGLLAGIWASNVGAIISAFLVVAVGLFGTDVMVKIVRDM